MLSLVAYTFWTVKVPENSAEMMRSILEKLWLLVPGFPVFFDLLIGISENVTLRIMIQTLKINLKPQKDDGTTVLETGCTAFPVRF